MKKPISLLLIVTLIMGIMAGCSKAAAEEEDEFLPTPELQAIKPITEVIPDYYPLTTEERELIWQTIYAEVRGCTCPEDECMVYVAQCIRDRVLVEGYGSTVEQVVTAKNQFAYYRGEASDGLDARINSAIDKVFKDGYFAFDEPILHFHADYVTPSWACDFEQLAYIDGTIFYN